MRALLWKEWREGWPTVLAGAVAMGGLWLVWGWSDPRERTWQAWRTWLIWSRVVLLVAAALLGGRAFASEMEAGTEGFLLALPARRGACWSAKVVPVLLLLVLLAVLPAWFEMEPWVRRSYPVGLLMPAIGCRWALLAVAAGSLSLFFSTVIPRTITAILATLATAPLAAFLSGYSIEHTGRDYLDFGEHGELLGFRGGALYEMALLGAIAILALLTSRWIYGRKSVPR